MKNNFTENNFIENLVNDYKVFGEDTIDIYNEIFSAVLGEDVDISEGFMDTWKFWTDPAKQQENMGFLNTWSTLALGRKAKAIEDMLKDGKLTDFQAASKSLKLLADPTSHIPLASVARQNGLGGMFKELFSRLGKAKTGVSEVFAKSGTFKDILKNGISWVQDPMNSSALSSLGVAGGGIVAIALIIRKLLKKRKLNKYRELQNIYNTAVQNNKAAASVVTESFQEELPEDVQEILNVFKPRFFNY